MRILENSSFGNKSYKKVMKSSIKGILFDKAFSSLFF